MSTDRTVRIHRVLRSPPVTLRSSEVLLQARHHPLLAGAGWPCGGLSEPAEQRSAAGSGRLRPKSDVSEAPYPGPSCRTCPGRLRFSAAQTAQRPATPRRLNKLPAPAFARAATTP